VLTTFSEDGKIGDRSRARYKALPAVGSRPPGWRWRDLTVAHACQGKVQMSGSSQSTDVGYLSLGNAFGSLPQQALLSFGAQLGKLLHVLFCLLVLDVLQDPGEGTPSTAAALSVETITRKRGVSIARSAIEIGSGRVTTRRLKGAAS